MLLLDTHRAFEKDMQVPEEYKPYLEAWKQQTPTAYLLSNEDKTTAFTHFMQDKLSEEMQTAVENSIGTEEEKNELKNRVAKEEMLWAAQDGKNFELFPVERAKNMSSEQLLKTRFLSSTLKAACSNPAEVEQIAKEQELLHAARNLTDNGYPVISAEIKGNQLEFQVLPVNAPACEVHVNVDKPTEPLVYIFVKDGKEEAVSETQLLTNHEGTLKPDPNRYEATPRDILIHSSIEMSSHHTEPNYDQAKKALLVSSLSGFLASRTSKQRGAESAELARMSMMQPLAKDRPVNVVAAQNAVAARMARQNLTEETLRTHALEREERAQRMARSKGRVAEEKTAKPQNPQKQLAQKVGVGVGAVTGLLAGVFGSSFGIIHITSLLQ